jgi:hypothetical protein
VLGRNAPEPFQKNSLRQTLLWNGKDDLGEYVKDPAAYNPVHDAAGNLTSVPSTDGSPNPKFVYDCRNRLSPVKTQADANVARYYHDGLINHADIYPDKMSEQEPSNDSTTTGRGR